MESEVACALRRAGAELKRIFQDRQKPCAERQAHPRIEEIKICAKNVAVKMPRMNTRTIMTTGMTIRMVTTMPMAWNMTTGRW